MHRDAPQARSICTAMAQAMRGRVMVRSWPRPGSSVSSGARGHEWPIHGHRRGFGRRRTRLAGVSRPRWDGGVTGAAAMPKIQRCNGRLPLSPMACRDSPAIRSQRVFGWPSESQRSSKKTAPHRTSAGRIDDASRECGGRARQRGSDRRIPPWRFRCPSIELAPAAWRGARAGCLVNAARVHRVRWHSRRIQTRSVDAASRRQPRFSSTGRLWRCAPQRPHRSCASSRRPARAPGPKPLSSDVRPRSRPAGRAGHRPSPCAPGHRLA